MSDKKTIGLMGAIVDNSNMGCVALTYSLIGCLEKIAKKNKTEFNYIIFEFSYNPQKYDLLCEALSIPRERLKWAPVGFIHKLTSKIKHYKKNNSMKDAVKSCDMVIDLTQGDSFTDIYGQERFDTFTKIKELVEKLGVPLVLGPQTYGPFNKEKNKNYAKKVIEKADLVISRDMESADYINSFSHKKVEVTTDLAFMLPYNKSETSNDKITVGVNVSGLLLKNKNESTETKFKLKTDYDSFIHRLLGALTLDERYEVHLIPHVGADGVKQIAEKFPTAIAHSEFYSPVEAKSLISGMDIFIGARMHATVAAFSTGVATIPTAYSRKFSGLYGNLGYDFVVDLQSLNTDEAVAQTLEFAKRYRELMSIGKECMDEISLQSNRTISLLENMIFNID